MAQHDGRTQLLLELLDRVGQARLRGMTALRGPAEMPFLGERHKVLELPQEHGSYWKLVLKGRISRVGRAHFTTTPVALPPGRFGSLGPSPSFTASMG
jgi:hypothetical protein